MTGTGGTTPTGEDTGDEGRAAGVDRRRLLKRAAIGGAVAWTTPVIVTSLTSPAGAASCGCTATAVSIVGACQNETTITPGTCTSYFSNSVSVCRSTATQKMRFARNSTGTQEPYFDELAVLSVTSPSGSTVVGNFIRWQNDCRVSGGTDWALSSSSPCGSTSVAAIDITSMFGSECGIFTVSIDVRNKYTPYAWSTAWIVPV